MYKNTAIRLLTVSVGFGLLSTACHKVNINNKDLRNFEEVNLIANDASYNPGLVDPVLQNAWGLAWSPSGIAWVNGEADGISALFTGAGAIVRPPVLIPSPTDTMGGAPTGIVFNSTKGFVLPNKAAATFIFVGDDGVVSAWNGAAGNKAFRIADNSAISSYTGLTLAWDNGRNLLYAANFKTGKIDVWDTSWAPVSLPFRDPGLPRGYSPFNIQAVSSWIYVSYAKVGPDGDEVHAVGLGLVDVFNPDGSFVKRFTTGGWLNAPWGVTMAPAGWLTTADMSADMSKADNNVKSGKGETMGPVVLIGNFG
ncbi:MAG TPA: TIGR03118 family protein, partial [Puia sp.]|nr:TIGR03118 family protein [Puia sp.]